MSIGIQWGQKTQAEDGRLVSEPRLEFGLTTFSVRVYEPAGQANPEEKSILVEISGFGPRRYMYFGSPEEFERFDHVPYEDDRFAWAADLLFRRLGAKVRPVRMLFWVVKGDPPDGEWLPVERERVREINVLDVVGPIWCPVANMRAERPYGPDGRETRRGSKHFVPGAKLYCGDYFWGDWGDGYGQIGVAGHHRGSHRWVKMIISSSWLTNWRTELVYDPAVIKAFWPTWTGDEASKQRAQHIVDMMRQWEATRTAPEPPTP